MNTDTQKWQRLDNRRTPGHQGSGPDADEVRDKVTNSGGDHLTENGFNFTAEGGFWKESEFRKCRDGKKMISDYRGLPAGYALGRTWVR